MTDVILRNARNSEMIKLLCIVIPCTVVLQTSGQTRGPIMFSVTIACVVLVITGYIIKSIIKPNKYPPGPKWYPFLGSSAIVQRLTNEYGSQWKAVSVLAKQYSTQVLGLKLGSEPVVVVFGEKNLRKVFTEKEFEGRPDTFFFRLRCLGKRMGITFTDGPLWKEHRNFTVRHLKNVGFGKTSMEKEIQTEMQHILEYIGNNRNKPINPKMLLNMSVMNVLWKFTAGERIKEDRLIFLLDLLNKRSKAFSMSGGWLNQWPWLRHIMPDSSGYNLIKEINKQISYIIEEAIEKHKNGEIKDNDYIYMFLEETKRSKDTFTEEQLKIICLDILIAGSQTTGNSLEFALLVALRNDSIQNKIYEEIDRILGDDMPCWADTSRLIYTMAFLLEVQRYYVIVPVAGPRRVLKDYVLDGYLLPKETTVLLAVGDVHFDPELWDEPQKFMPERFIDERGMLRNIEHMYPFGLGRRRCPGDSLAKSFMFIVFVGIMQKYKICCCNGVLPSDEPIIGILSGPRPFSADFVPRK